MRARTSCLHSMFLIGSRHTEFEDVYTSVHGPINFFHFEAFVHPYLPISNLRSNLENRLGKQQEISVHRL